MQSSDIYFTTIVQKYRKHKNLEFIKEECLSNVFYFMLTIDPSISFAKSFDLPKYSNAFRHILLIRLLTFDANWTSHSSLDGNSMFLME